MITLIIGYPDSGKSAMAERMVTEMSEPGERVYLATMIPFGQEGRDRIARHRKLREGKGFRTVEAPFDVRNAVTALEQEGIELQNMTVLLECVSNLTANELFERHTGRDELVLRLCADIRAVAEMCRNLVIVTNHFEIEDGFDEDTRIYAETLDKLNEEMSRFADNTIRL